MTFTNQLTSMISKEATAAHGDHERMGALVETLARSLGFTVALACRGDAAAIDEMMTGAEGYAHGEAVAKAPFAAFMAVAKGRR